MTRTPTLTDLRTQWRDGSLASCDVEWLIDEVERLTRELAVARDDMRDCRTMLSAAEEERDAALRDNAALREMMPSEEDAAIAVGYMCQISLPNQTDYAAWQRVTAALRRLSPPSAPATNGGE